MNDLYDTYSDKGFQIMMFPSNTFKQEPYNDQKIEKVYRGKLGARWWIGEAVEVNGAGTHPLYQHLRYNSAFLNVNKGSGRPEMCHVIPWNYAKFLVDSEGNVVHYAPPQDSPMKLVPFMAAYLNK